VKENWIFILLQAMLSNVINISIAREEKIGRHQQAPKKWAASSNACGGADR
jgi:hypothetical protein